MAADTDQRELNSTIVHVNLLGAFAEELQGAGQCPGGAAEDPAAMATIGKVDKNKFHKGFCCHRFPGADEPGLPWQPEATLWSHPAAHFHRIAMHQWGCVVDGQMHNWQLQPLGREDVVGKPRGCQGLHSCLLQPGHVGPVPHHAGMIGVLGQYTPVETPACLRRRHRIQLHHALWH